MLPLKTFGKTLFAMHNCIAVLELFLKVLWNIEMVEELNF